MLYFSNLRTLWLGAFPESDYNMVSMNLNPLKYCFHGQHSRPRATFRTLPGVRNKRAVCAECYEKIMADRKQKKLAAAAR